MRTISEKHARDIADTFVARCTDLTFDIDLGNGKWYDASGMLVWNMGIEAIAFVGMLYVGAPIGALPEVQYTLAS